jgi:hypothetical protein
VTFLQPLKNLCPTFRTTLDLSYFNFNENLTATQLPSFVEAVQTIDKILHIESREATKHNPVDARILKGT